jgi:hypothetical protein
MKIDGVTRSCGTSGKITDLCGMSNSPEIYLGLPVVSDIKF